MIMNTMEEDADGDTVMAIFSESLVCLRHELLASCHLSRTLPPVSYTTFCLLHCLMSLASLATLASLASLKCV